jgi:AcrR family transcriptional regulator
MSNKQPQPTDRRLQILDAAERIFSRKGFDKARMDDIVKEAGLSKGSLYWYFKSKDELIRALLDRVFISEMQEAEALAEMPGSAEDKLKAFIEIAVREYKHFEKILPLSYEFVALAARSKAVRSVIVGYFRHYLDMMAQIIQEGIESGEFRTVDADVAASSLISMYEGLAMLWFLEPGLVDWNRMSGEPLGIFLHGMRRKSEA